MNPRERVTSVTERVIKLNEDSGLKISSEAWGLDVGQGLGRTSINLSLHDLFPYLLHFQHICLNVHTYI